MEYNESLEELLDGFVRKMDDDPMQSYDSEESIPTFSLTARKAPNSDSPSSCAKSLVQPPQFYAVQIANALNSHDSHFLLSCLHQLSTSELIIGKYVFSLFTRRKGVEERVFSSLEEFCQYMEVWNRLIPDGVFEASLHRKCITDPPTSVFISTLFFSGQKIVKDVDVLDDDLCVYYPRLSQMMMNKLDNSECPEIVVISGSLVVYVNEDGFIEKLDFFFSLNQ